jgi:transposase
MAHEAGLGRRPCHIGVFEPAKQSGLDLVTYPRLSPLMERGARGAECSTPEIPQSLASFRGCAMDTTYAKVAGLDVHHKMIQCAVRCQELGKLQTQSRSFGTMTVHLHALADYLEALGVTHVALESTGVLWKPVWNILEGRFTLLLVNPRHLKKVPGRKTDVSDAQWIAQLLQCGLLKSSFVPPREVRNLRDLTRHRAQLVAERTRVANRIRKLLEDTNVKLGAVASDVLGVSGRAMLQALLQGETDVNKMADLAQNKLRNKIPQLRLALHGKVTDHHRFVLKRLLTHLDFLENEGDLLSEEIGRIVGQLLTCDDFNRLDAIPGISRISIQNIIAEIGPDMSVFPDAHHLCSWTGICPGNEESAGKRLRSGIRHGNRWLRRALSESAWAASRSKNSYFVSQFRRIAARRGKNRALLAVAHSLLVVIYNVLKHHKEYQDLGHDYFDRQGSEHLQRYLISRLERLGNQVIVKPIDPDHAA